MKVECYAPLNRYLSKIGSRLPSLFRTKETWKLIL